ncbi:beta-lactamase/transpeptidase-like protein [Infundibulicybe gibba]|nr:beta-lactamase/transpeptidase-like protein [Infundibulicybe gibba]
MATSQIQLRRYLCVHTRPQGGKSDRVLLQDYSGRLDDLFPTSTHLGRHRMQGDLPAVPLLFEPGTDWVYGFGSDCIGFIIERITGQTLEEYCKEHIFNPLGLKSTSFYLTPDLKARFQSLAFREANGALVRFTNQYGVIEHDPQKSISVLVGLVCFRLVKIILPSFGTCFKYQPVRPRIQS